MNQVQKVFERVNREHLKIWVSEDDPTFQSKLDFAISRFQTGVDLKRTICRDYPDNCETGMTVLDLGGGNGGVILPLAVDGTRCVSMDVFAHFELLEVVRQTGLTVFVTTGIGELLPFADGCFDIVFYIETIEHVNDARRVGWEVARVLKPGGICLITTPPRLTFAFRGDPHYGVRGIVLLPNSCQRWIVERVARVGTPYDVSHLYWTVPGIMRTMPGLRLSRVYSSARWRFLRWFDWDLIVAVRP